MPPMIFIGRFVEGCQFTQIGFFTQQSPDANAKGDFSFKGRNPLVC
jgi:hypothetical protein